VHAVVAGALFDRSFFQILILLGVGFVYAFALLELARSGSRGWVKAIWVVAIVAIPILGALVYLAASPSVDLGVDPTHDRFKDPEHPTDVAYGTTTPRPFG
jgi:Phospholipase_D-nuclease N-terminal